jgi:hypothetical protein
MKDNDIEMPGNNVTPAFAGSSPAMRTIFPQEIEVSSVTDPAITQERLNPKAQT